MFLRAGRRGGIICRLINDLLSSMSINPNHSNNGSNPVEGTSAQPGAHHNDYAQPGVNNQYSAQPTDNQWRQMEASQQQGLSSANTSKVLGIIALVLSVILVVFPLGEILPLILGFIGVSKANKAKRFGVPAKGGKIMNILAIIISLLVIALVIIAAIMLANNPDFQQMIRDAQNQVS